MKTTISSIANLKKENEDSKANVEILKKQKASIEENINNLKKEHKELADKVGLLKIEILTEIELAESKHKLYFKKGRLSVLVDLTKNLGKNEKYYDKFFDNNFTNLFQIQEEIDILIEFLNRHNNKKTEEKIISNLNRKAEDNNNNNINEKAKETNNNNISISTNKIETKDNNKTKEKYFEKKISKFGLAMLDDFDNYEYEDNDSSGNDNKIIPDVSQNKTNSAIKPVTSSINISNNIIGTINYQPPVNDNKKIDDYNALDSSLPELFDLIYDDKNFNEPSTVIPAIFDNAEQYKIIWNQFISHETFLEVNDHYRNLRRHTESIRITSFNTSKFRNFNAFNFNITTTRKIIYKYDLVFFHDTLIFF